MPRKSLGYVQLEWTCPRCGARNPGTQATCLSCGGPQPQDTAFQQAEGQELITGEKAEEIAKMGADIVCGFCGTRNPGNATVCKQCGADLKAGDQRASGAVLGTRQSGPAAQVKCPNCGEMNPPAALKCTNCGAPLAVQATAAAPTPAPEPTPQKKGFRLSRLVSILVFVGIAVVILVLIGVLGKRKTVPATVTNVTWDTSVQIQAYQPVEHNDWRADLPSGVSPESCDLRYFGTSNDPGAVSTEVCGTPYTIDKGNGFGEEVQDCEYQVYEEYCTYSVTEWTVVDEATSHGTDLNWYYPQPNLTSNQRLGDSAQNFRISFSSANGDYTYETRDQGLFQQAAIGSHWDLQVSALNTVLTAAPSE